MDIAAAISIATGHYSDNEFNKFSNEIIDFSYHISHEIKESIIKNKVIRDGLVDYGKNISLIDIKSDRKAIECLFKDKKSYFDITFPRLIILSIIIAFRFGIKVMIIRGLTGPKKFYTHKH